MNVFQTLNDKPSLQKTLDKRSDYLSHMFYTVLVLRHHIPLEFNFRVRCNLFHPAKLLVI